ncbi:MAG: hypothetical protein WB780_21210 [Candidatus Acidiferrales bacterium]
MENEQPVPDPQQQHPAIPHLQDALKAISAMEQQTADYIASGAQVSFRNRDLASFPDNLKRVQDAIARALALA